MSKTGVHLDGYNSMLQRPRSSGWEQGSVQQLVELSPTIDSVIKPSKVVRDLGVFTDDVARLVSSCFFQLRRRRQVRRRVSRPVLKQLVHSFVVSGLDYCNGILAGLLARSLAQLHRVQNAAARLVLRLRAHDHVTAALRELHWLAVKYRIQ